MSSIDDDLFGPIDGAGGSTAADDSEQSDQMIEQLFHLMSSMHQGEEVTLNFDRPEGTISFQLRLLGKIVP